MRDKETVREILTKIPLLVGLLLVGGAVFAGLYWLVNRL